MRLNVRPEEISASLSRLEIKGRISLRDMETQLQQSLSQMNQVVNRPREGADAVVRSGTVTGSYSDSSYESPSLWSELYALEKSQNSRIAVILKQNGAFFDNQNSILTRDLLSILTSRLRINLRTDAISVDLSRIEKQGRVYLYDMERIIAEEGLKRERKAVVGPGSVLNDPRARRGSVFAPTTSLWAELNDMEIRDRRPLQAILEQMGARIDSKTGSISRQNLSEAIRKLNIRTPVVEVEAALDSVENKQNRAILYKDVVELVRLRGKVPDSTEAQMLVRVYKSVLASLRERNMSVHDLFSRLDYGRDQFVSKDEFHSLLTVLPLRDVRNEDLDILFASLDVNGDGRVDVTEFSSKLDPLFLSPLVQGLRDLLNTSKQPVATVLGKLSVDRNGCVTRADLTRALTRLNLRDVREDEIKRILDLFVTDPKLPNSINFKMFENAMYGDKEAIHTVSEKAHQETLHAALTSPEKVCEQLLQLSIRLRKPVGGLMNLSLNRDGTVTKANATKGLTNLKLPGIIANDIKVFLDSLDPRSTGKIIYADIAGAVQSYQAVKSGQAPPGSSIGSTTVADDTDRILVAIRDDIASKRLTVRQAFGFIDTSRDGFIDRLELERALQAMRINLTPADMDRLLNRLDRNRDGRISVDEFETLLSTASVNPVGVGSVVGSGNGSGIVGSAGLRPAVAVAVPVENKLDMTMYEHLDWLDAKGVDFNKFMTDLEALNNKTRGGIKVRDWQLCFDKATARKTPADHVKLIELHFWNVKEKKFDFYGFKSRMRSLFLLREMTLILTDDGMTVDQCFEHFDRDRSGTLSPDEFRIGLSNLAIDVSPDDLRLIVTFLDTDRNGFVDLPELKAHMRHIDNPTKPLMSAPVQAAVGSSSYSAPSSIFNAVPATGSYSRYGSTLTAGSYDARLPLAAGTSAASLREEEELFGRLQRWMQDKRFTVGTLFRTSLDRLPVSQFMAELQSAGCPLIRTDVNRLVTMLDPRNEQVIRLSDLERRLMTSTSSRFNDYSVQSRPAEPLRGADLIFEQIRKELERLNVTAEEAFRTLDRGDRGEVESQQLQQFIHDLRLNLRREDIALLADALDVNRDGKISVNEFLLRIRGVEDRLTDYEKQNRVIIDSDMMEEVKSMFDFFDKDKNGSISREELEMALRALGHETSREELRAIMDSVDKDRSNGIDLHEFYALMEPRIKSALLSEHDEMEDLRSAFREADRDQKGMLTRRQIRYALQTLNISLNQDELESLVQEADVDNNDQIDIDEFIAMMKQGQWSTDRARGAYRKLQKAKRLNPLDYISAFVGMPSSFRPSPLRELERSKKHLPSSGVDAMLDRTGLGYRDILPVGGKQRDALRPLDTPISAQVTLMQARGVPVPDDNNRSNIVRRHVRVCLFDKRNRKFIGNGCSIGATWSEQYGDEWRFGVKKSSADNSLLARVQPSGNRDDLMVVFELNLVLAKVDGKLSEMTCGWGALSLSELENASSNTIDVPVKGGTVVQESDIDPSDVMERKGIKAALTKAFKSDKSVKSILTLKVNRIQRTELNDINMLPANLICPFVSIDLLKLFRLRSASVLLATKEPLKAPTLLDPVLTAFPKILDTPDMFEALRNYWAALPNRDRNSPDVFSQTVLKLWPLFASPQYGFSDPDPSSYHNLDSRTLDSRRQLIAQCLNGDLRSLFMEGSGSGRDRDRGDVSLQFKPFKMDEITFEAVPMCQPPPVLSSVPSSKVNEMRGSNGSPYKRRGSEVMSLAQLA